MPNKQARRQVGTQTGREGGREGGAGESKLEYYTILVYLAPEQRREVRWSEVAITSTIQSTSTGTGITLSSQATSSQVKPSQVSSVNLPLHVGGSNTHVCMSRARSRQLSAFPFVAAHTSRAEPSQFKPTVMI